VNCLNKQGGGKVSPQLSAETKGAGVDSSEDNAEVLVNVATMLGVEVHVGRDAFDRTYIDISHDGLRRIHDVALERGHLEVAADVRQMMVRAERRKKPGD
jgi:hypothetical protein